MLLSIAVLSLLWGAANADDRSPNVALLTANPIYQKNCAKCHGKGATGRRFGEGTTLVSDKVATASAGDLRNIITNGKGRMPKFGSKISASDIDALILQLKAANTK